MKKFVCAVLILIIAGELAALILINAAVPSNISTPKDPIEVSNGLAGTLGNPVTTIEVTSMVDHILIMDVTFNRGNCHFIDFFIKLPVELKFGQKLTLVPYSTDIQHGCDVIETEIQTSQGHFSFGKGGML